MSVAQASRKGAMDRLYALAAADGTFSFLALSRDNESGGDCVRGGHVVATAGRSPRRSPTERECGGRRLVRVPHSPAFQAFPPGDPPMRVHPPSVRRAIALGALTPLFALSAQTRPPATATTVEMAGVTKKIDAPKTLQLEDYARFNRITAPAVSPDGKWMTFTLSPNEGGQTFLHVKALDGSKEYTANVGGGAGGGRAGGGGGRGGASPSAT